MALRPDKSIRGFTIPELLIAMAITGLLLAAIAVVFNASVMNYRTNEDIIRVTNNARQTLSRITSQLRTAEAVDPNASSNRCSFFTATNEDITYEFRSADSKLYLITNSNGQEYVLCDNVTAMTFTRQTGIDDDGETFVKSVQISMTLVSGNAERKVSAAAVIRRNLK